MKEEITQKENVCTKNKSQASGVLESVVALLILIYALPVSAVLVKGTISILYPPAKCEVSRNG
jgi:hypothetical protein